ncbi:hypothetical protein [Phaffia rhodozyma]|uniref:Uncharacterized protein n=1 Tax=Phaffia rhodozyma TaxID=264483 RepID=A0A0F7SKI6_PHARH|nr:hypothetical protein [Phaffia rhodozyma]
MGYQQACQARWDICIRTIGAETLVLAEEKLARSTVEVVLNKPAGTSEACGCEMEDKTSKGRVTVDFVLLAFTLTLPMFHLAASASATLLPTSSFDRLPTQSFSRHIPYSFTLPPTASSSSSEVSDTSQPVSNSLPRGPIPHIRPRPTARRTIVATAAANRTRIPSSSRRAAQISSARSQAPRSVLVDRASSRDVERALDGRLPLGMNLVLEDQDLSDEELEILLKNREIRDYGRTFLIPIGCRRTQEEIDAVQSRSPSPAQASNAEDHIHMHGRVQDALDTSASLNPDEQPDLDRDISDEDLDENEDISED